MPLPLPRPFRRPRRRRRGERPRASLDGPPSAWVAFILAGLMPRDRCERTGSRANERFQERRLVNGGCTAAEKKAAGEKGCCHSTSESPPPSWPPPRERLTADDRHSTASFPGSPLPTVSTLHCDAVRLSLPLRCSLASLTSADVNAFNDNPTRQSQVVTRTLAQMFPKAGRSVC